jgi:outer membrane protein TolC
MSRQIHSVWLILALAAMAAAGCQPMQPLFFAEDGDLSHYMDVATALENPDVDHTPLDEVTQSHAPLTLENVDKYERWYISLEEVLQTVLSNSQVMRTVGGRVVRSNYATAVNEKSSTSLSSRIIAAGGATTSYDPAIVESAYGVSTGSDLSGGVGPEAALAAFDARLDGSMIWEKQDRPQNVKLGDPTVDQILIPTLQQDLGTFGLGLTKTAASGGTMSFFNNTRYDLSNTPSRALPSAYNTDFTAQWNQPLLQGAGAQYNRIAGPHSFNAYQQGFANQIDGVVIGRIRHDITLAQFEGQLIELIQEAETAYWDLYYAYRELEANKQGQEYSREVWEKKNGDPSASAADKSRARAEYFRFRAEVEASLTNLMGFENRLRYLMGLAIADGRLLTPKDEPTTAGIEFDWCLVHPEAIARRVEVRKQKWEMKKREMELIAARNHLLPRLDAVGNYRFLGMGDDLIDNNGSGLLPQQEGSNAFEALTSGQYQEWQLGLQLSMPLGFRQALTGVRHQQLLLAREKALLDDLELEISHQLGEAYRILDSQHHIIQTTFNRRIAAEEEVKAMRIAEEEGRITLDSLLDAERRKVDSQIAYYRSLTDYNMAIMRVHYRKGSLLEYNNVYLNEGPWPKKAYFDALREARRRDGAKFIDYGFTRPGVVSQGPVEQHANGGPHEMMEDGYSEEHHMHMDDAGQQSPTPATQPAEEVKPMLESEEPVMESDEPMLETEEPAAPESARSQRSNNGPLLQPASVSRGDNFRSRGIQQPATADSWQRAKPASMAATRAASQGRTSSGVRQMSFEQLSGQQRYESGKTKSAAGSAASATEWQRAQR